MKKYSSLKTILPFKKHWPTISNVMDMTSKPQKMVKLLLNKLDPISTLKIEELMHDLSKEYTIIIVTHNMQQAARVSEFTAFFSLTENRAGALMEFGPTIQLFTNPKNKITEDYITGRFG